MKPTRPIPWRVYARQPDNVHFPHAVHVKRAGLACARCHGPHGTTDALRPFEQNRVSGYSRDVGRGMKMSDCEDCHARHGRAHTSCLACHR